MVQSLLLLLLLMLIRMLLLLLIEDPGLRHCWGRNVVWWCEVSGAWHEMLWAVVVERRGYVGWQRMEQGVEHLCQVRDPVWGWGWWLLGVRLPLHGVCGHTGTAVHLA